MKRKNIGISYLHRHPEKEQSLNVDAEHVIVDRKEWEEVVNYFRQHPERMAEIKER